MRLRASAHPARRSAANWPGTTSTSKAVARLSSTGVSRWPVPGNLWVLMVPEVIFRFINVHALLLLRTTERLDASLRTARTRSMADTYGNPSSMHTRTAGALPVNSMLTTSLVAPSGRLAAALALGALPTSGGAASMVSMRAATRATSAGAAFGTIVHSARAPAAS